MQNAKVKADAFEVGDEVWCAVYGEGKVISVFTSGAFPVKVIFKNTNFKTYTQEGRYYFDTNRTLFFSKPEIIPGATTRPFKPTLVGRKVVVAHKTAGLHQAGIVEGETINRVLIDDYWFSKRFYDIHIIEQTI